MAAPSALLPSRSRIEAHRCAGALVEGCRAATPVALTVLRGGKTLHLSLYPRYDKAEKRMLLGVQFGVAATFTRFREGINPYFWNLDVVLSTSVKGDSSGVGFIQQADVLRLDAPDLWNHHLRVDTRGSFTRTINEGYYGIGNASNAGPDPGQADSVRLNQYIQEEARVRAIARIHTGTLFDDTRYIREIHRMWVKGDRPF